MHGMQCEIILEAQLQGRIKPLLLCSVRGSCPNVRISFVIFAMGSSNQQCIIDQFGKQEAEDLSFFKTPSSRAVSIILQKIVQGSFQIRQNGSRGERDACR